jgi:hypothetical protein
MAILTREKILATTLPTQVVPVPEWGGEVIVRALTGSDRDKFDLELQRVKDSGEQPNIRGLMAVLCVVDEDGNQVFTHADIAELAKKNAKPLDRIFDVAAPLSGLAKDVVEDAEKNSVGDRSGSGGSGSPRVSAAPSRKSKRG